MGICLRRLDTEQGRAYQTPIGLLPSVSTILSQLPLDEGIVEWRDRVGVKAADEHMRECGVIGDRIHLLMDQAAKTRTAPKGSTPEGKCARAIWRFGLKSKYPDNSEFRVWSRSLMMAGTVDALIGEIIIDYKTCSMIPSEPHKSHVMQVASYVVAAAEMGENVRKGKIIYVTRPYKDKLPDVKSFWISPEEILRLTPEIIDLSEQFRTSDRWKIMEEEIRGKV